MKIEKPWHMRLGPYGRAFVTKPKNPYLFLILWLRGYRSNDLNHMTKPSRNQRVLETLMALRETL